MAVALAAGCSTAPEVCGFVGDEAAPMEAAGLFVLDPGAAPGYVETTGAVVRVPLRQPVQGGFVLYTGLLLRNLESCRVKLRAQLRDPTTKAVISNLDQREADLEPAPAPHDGWWRPVELDSLSTVPNIPACPDALGRGIANKDALIEIVATDPKGRTVTTTAEVLPVCPDNELEAACECSCGPDFVPGKCGS